MTTTSQPRQDPIVDAVARLMERSNIKALALESLPEADRRALEEERGAFSSPSRRLADATAAR